MLPETGIFSETCPCGDQINYLRICGSGFSLPFLLGYYQKCYRERQLIAAYTGQNLSISCVKPLVVTGNFSLKENLQHDCGIARLLGEAREGNGSEFSHKFSHLAFGSDNLAAGIPRVR